MKTCGADSESTAPGGKKSKGENHIIGISKIDGTDDFDFISISNLISQFQFLNFQQSIINFHVLISMIDNRALILSYFGLAVAPVV